MGAVITIDPANFYGFKTLKFLLQNSTLLGTEVRLPGVFKNNIFRDAVNGSIWTLPIEAVLYVGFALLAAVAAFDNRKMLFALTATAILLCLFSLLVCDISTDFAIKNDHFARFYGAVFLGGALLALAETLFQGILLLAAVAAVFALTGQR